MKYVILASMFALPMASYAQQNSVISFKGQVDDASKTATSTEFELELTSCGAAVSATAILIANNITTNSDLKGLDSTITINPS